MKPLLTIIPTFTGFYESIHSGKIDDAENSLVQDDSGEPIPALAELIWRNIDYRKVEEGYSKEYVDNFSTLHKIPLRFETLDSPREYNFTTDRLYAYISLATAKRLYASTPQGTLAQRIKERFTSRDGFSSFYSNDLQDDEWQQPLVDWDANMLSTLVGAYLLGANSYDDLIEQEWYMVDDENSFISNLVWECLPSATQNEISAKREETA